jgi:hypothetical protein
MRQRSNENNWIRVIDPKKPNTLRMFRREVQRVCARGVLQRNRIAVDDSL